MNRGDKVVCINNLANKNGNFISGNLYEILLVNMSSIYVNSYNPRKGLWFNMHNSFFFKHHFSDYFITLAEWRDKQINSILYD